MKRTFYLTFNVLVNAMFEKEVKDVHVSASTNDIHAIWPFVNLN